MGVTVQGPADPCSVAATDRGVSRLTLGWGGRALGVRNGPGRQQLRGHGDTYPWLTTCQRGRTAREAPSGPYSGGPRPVADRLELLAG